MSKGDKVPPDLVALRGLHGTGHDIPSEVLPGRVHGNSTYGGNITKNDTYFTPVPEQRHLDALGSDEPLSAVSHEAEEQSWKWAMMTARGNRPRVYATEPQGEQRFDGNVNRAPNGLRQATAERVAPSQKIVDTLWAPPPSPGGFVEQTLPHINWQQFGGSNWTMHRGPGPVSEIGELF